MGNQAAHERRDIRPARLGQVEPGVHRSIGEGFSSLRFRGPLFDRDADAILMLDHFVMTRDTFAPHLHQRTAIITALFEDSRGSFLNRDTVGCTIALQGGDVYRLEAAAGAVHEQRPSDGASIHALQIIVKLPHELDQKPPHARHVRHADVPVLTGSGYRVRALLGAQGAIGADGRADDTTLLDGVIDAGASFVYRLPRGRKAWLYVVSGRMRLHAAQGQRVLDAGQMTAVGAGEPTDIAMHGATPTHFVLVATAPVAEARALVPTPQDPHYLAIPHGDDDVAGSVPDKSRRAAFLAAVLRQSIAEETK